MPSLPAAGSRGASKAYAWVVVGLFWLVFFLNQGDRQVIFSVFPLVKSEMGLTDTQLGAISSAFFWVYAILVPVAGSLGDLCNRKWIVVGALSLWSAATLGSSFAAGLGMLVVMRALTASGEAFYWPAAGSMIGDYHGDDTRSTALSIHQTANYAGVMVCGGLAGYIAQSHGWRSAFAVFGLAGIVVAVVAAKFLVEPARGQADRVVGRESGTVLARALLALRSPTFVLHTLAFMVMLFALTAYLTWMPTLLYRKFGMDLASAGLHATLWHHLGAVAGTLIGGRQADRWTARTVVSRPLIQAFGLFCGAPFIFVTGWADSRLTVLLGLAAFGFFRGLYDANIMASLYAVIRPSGRATATGLMIAGAFVGGGIGPLFTGRLSESHDLGFAISATSIFYVIGGLLLSLDCLFFYRRGVARALAQTVSTS